MMTVTATTLTTTMMAWREMRSRRFADGGKGVEELVVGRASLPQ